MTTASLDHRTSARRDSSARPTRKRMTTFTTVLTTVTALAAATVGGAFFTFSGFVMAALGRLDAPSAVRAMQSINVTAVNPPLMILLFGTGLLTLVTAWRGVTALGTSYGVWLLAASALYLVGVIGVTIVANVPMNDALAAMDPTATDTATYWTTYLSHWTAWNTVRTVAGVASGLGFVAALLSARGSR